MSILQQQFQTLVEWMTSATGNISDLLYTYILIILLIAGGLFFTVRSKFAQFRLFPEQIRAVTEKPKDGKGVSSFQALMVSTASRVGTGNIIGVATAICIGGFGSVFWMWLIAIIGSASALFESSLAQIFKKRGKDGCYGGPAYYIEGALKLRWLAVIFSVLLIITYGFGFNMLASYNLQSTFAVFDFYDPTVTPWIIGGIVAALVAFCLFGGGKRLVKVTSFLVPIMGVAYILIALVVVALNITLLPAVIVRIFKEAFDLTAIFGGFTGSCVMYGIKRGLFSNEAGVGSAPNASASAEVSHPIKQGLVQVLSVFIDTILVCSSTAFMCMCSGVEPDKNLDGATYVQTALQSTFGAFGESIANSEVFQFIYSNLLNSNDINHAQIVVQNIFGAFGPVFIAVAMVLFAFTTLLGNLYYVDRCWFHIFKKEPGKVFRSIYYIIAVLVILVGAGLNAGLLWNIADITMGTMTIINIPVIFVLSKYVIRALKNYDAQRKEGKDPVFRAKDIELPFKVDYWQ